MKDYSFINSVLADRSNESAKVVIKKQNTLFTSFKRISAFGFGVAIVFVFYKAIEQEYDNLLSEEFFSFLPFLFFGMTLIYYSLFRMKFHKECFVDFSKNQIIGRIPAPLSEYNQVRTILIELMIAPKYEEFEYKRNEIIDIKIEMDTIEIISKEYNQIISLSNLGYKVRKELKKRFSDLNTSIHDAL